MSARISLLRDALAGLVQAADSLPIASGPLTRALRRADAALAATRFVAPDAFPAVVSTRSGAVVTLHALHEGALIGSHVDADGLQLQSWRADGTMFGPEDPDDFDLVLADDTPINGDALAPNVVVHDFSSNARDTQDTVVQIPILGRIS